MATGDITITVAIAGGSVSKAATVVSAHRVKAQAWQNRNRGGADEEPNLTDATWAVALVNSAASGIIHAAEKQLVADAAPSAPTFTAAT